MNTTAPTGLLQQPRPFFMIFFVELWERFGYYGVQGILAVFFVKQLGFSQEQAFITFGAFAALVYGLISIGGYVGDHLLGTKRTLVLGAIVLAIGYFMTGMSLLKPQLIFIALGTIAVGNGLFKAHPASLLSAEGCPSRRGIYPVLYVDKHRFAAVAVAGAGDRRKIWLRGNL